MSLYEFNQLRGLLTESLVFSIFSEHHKTSLATPEENMRFDIDFYADEHAVSVKTQHKGLETGNFSFELEQQLGRQYMDIPAGTWVRHQGWHVSEAEWYAIVQGNTVYVLKWSALHRHVKRNGWDRVVELSEGVRESQEGKLYCNARNGLIAREKAPVDAKYTFDTVYLDVIQDCVQQGLENIDISCLRNCEKTAKAIEFLAHCYRDCTKAVPRKLMAYNVMMSLQASEY
jgi:hypothetical protein